MINLIYMDMLNVNCSKSHRLVFIFLLFLFLPDVNAQVSLVPAQHQVYDWLHKQRIMGNIRFYSFETLPISRVDVFKILQEINQKSTLNKVDRSHLETYMLEFSIDSLRTAKRNTLLQGNDGSLKKTWKSKWDLLKSKNEPHLFIYEDSTSVVNLDYFSGTGLIDPTINGTKDRTRYKFNGLRTFGSVNKYLGFYLEVVNAVANSQGNSLSQLDYWGKTIEPTSEKTTSLYKEGFISFKYEKLSLDAGNGNIKYGVGNDETLIFRLKAANFDWVRIKYDSKYFQYTFIHGALPSEPISIVDPLNPNASIIGEVKRWVAMRRLQIRPFKWVQIAFTESLTYSNRGVELAYINPVYPLKISEFNTQDQDNPTWYLDGVIKPFRGLEFYGTLGIDDLFELSDIFKKTGNRSNETAVVSYQIGLNLVPKGLFHMNVEYLSIDPFFYTHKFGTNSYSTSIEHSIPLAHNIGPNADQIYMSIKKWMPWRGWIKGYFSSVRKGLNVIGENGEVILNAGGDINNGRNGGVFPVLFLSGDLHKYRLYGVESYVEPWRGLGIALNYQKRIVTQGDRISNFNQFGFRVTVTFYPINRVLGAILPSRLSISEWL